MEHTTPKNLASGFFWICLSYALCIAAGYFSYNYFITQTDALWAMWWADIVATIVIFAFSVVFRNSSFYDAYWSVIPFFIAYIWAQNESVFAVQERNWLVLIAYAAWGIRLTLNWARGWKGLVHEDWRYIDLKKKSGKMAWFTDLFGIHVFPTFIVFIAMVPSYYAMNASARPLQWLDYLALAVCLLGTLIELVADEQMKRFIKNKKSPEEVNNHGLWKISRHPNYLGEMTFWWGIYLFVLSANPEYYYTFYGALAMTCMFVFITGPMMDKHIVARRPSYAAYMDKTAPFIPFVRWS